METRDLPIVEAAIRVFTRYGVKRATMNDIALEAGVVRQTLYLSFRSKNEVLRAAIGHYADRIVDQIELDWRDASSLSDKLSIFFQHSVIEPYDALCANPDFEDLSRGYNDQGRVEVGRANRKLAALLQTALTPFADQLAESGQTVEDFADFAQLAAHDLKYSAKDAGHLSALIGSLKAAILRITGAD